MGGTARHSVSGFTKGVRAMMIVFAESKIEALALTNSRVFEGT